MHLKRLLTAAILLPFFYLYIMKLPPVFFAGLVAAMGLLATWEFLTFYGSPVPLKMAGLAMAALLLASTALAGRVFPDIFAVFILVAATARLFSLKEPSGALRDISVSIIALLYIPGLLIFQMLLREGGPQWIIFLYGTVWVGDSLALYVGSSIGKRKLYPSVSPKKTVEGAIGSITGGMAAAIIIRAVFPLGISYIWAAALGLLMGGSAIIGDLIESMFKRDAGVKDSGHILPGHGGILDKLDGPLFSAPVLYWSFIVFGLRF
ncbi:MAG: phosphatidate cytidylyltransferase [Nitrospiraceae bacterium]|nr:phosphatidate cytidylyltransferase [Nitrospiraceae bacterium]